MTVPVQAMAPAAGGNRFSCSLTAVLLGVVHSHGGPGAVTELIELAGSSRSREYLSDIAQWVSYDEAIALWRAGARITHHPQLARAVGEAAARQLNGSPWRVDDRPAHAADGPVRPSAGHRRARLMRRHGRRIATTG